ncbi:MAG: 2,3-bisphosphoglycerate-independent phosphoglycerate mutase [Sphingobacteriales bacterium JAD_PAG50586_3]|nr:MAG: 2,3-bisphosphoglycerate-independent phosphoglycerate mutase [Sphingobacteriales bacterium JAD_PAG50586_3]
MADKKVILVILDGWGIGEDTPANAVKAAQTPCFDSLIAKYPHSELRTDGLNVGLPEGQMGNSEVGHLNLGAGRVIYQDLVEINLATQNGDMERNEELVKAFEYARDCNQHVHLMGLVSDGCIHSSDKHLHKLCKIAKQYGLENVFVHAFTDGRDTDPKSGVGFLTALQDELLQSTGQIASVIGRYYAMDRDRRWERVAQAYNLLVNGIGQPTTNIIGAVEESYTNGITDEFIKPIVKVDADGNPVATIKPGDVVICFNYRTDRCREITEVLTQQDFAEQGMQKLENLYYLTMTPYDHSFTGVKVIFNKKDITNTLGEVLANAGKTQLRIAETEKYPHVTFFFSGGREVQFTGERRIMVPSAKDVPTYDFKPEMSAYGIAEAVVKDMDENAPDFICLNYANPDMVGHTGVFPAIIKAVETVDQCLQMTIDKAIEKGYSAIILADHGNAEYAINEDGTPNTAHTTNPVPCILIDSDYKTLQNGKLADIAPTILTLMGLKAPEEMGGNVLVSL